MLTKVFIEYLILWRDALNISLYSDTHELRWTLWSLFELYNMQDLIVYVFASNMRYIQ